MSPSAYWLFTRLRQGCSPEEITASIRSTFGQDLDAREVARACADLRASIEDQTALAEQRRRKRYAFRIRVLPESAVAWLARRLEILMRRPVLFLYVPLLVSGSYLLFFSDAPREVDSHLGSAAGFAVAYLIYLVALCAHELGHATACSRYRMRPGDIGFAVYLVFPAVYCDVTRAWLLPRWQRVVVDLSGLLFELGVGALCATLGAVFGVWVLTLAAFLVLGNLVWALNPFGRFDLYWTLNDALGLIDLSADRWRVLRDVFAPRSRPARPEDIRLGPVARAVLFVYGICSIAVIGLFGYGVVEIGDYVFTHLGASTAHLAAEAAQGHIASTLASGVSLLFPGLIAVVMGWRLGAMAIGPPLRWVRQRARRALSAPAEPRRRPGPRRSPGRWPRLRPPPRGRRPRRRYRRGG